MFSKSSVFTPSNHWDATNKFTSSSKQFTASIDFNSTHYFTASNTFTASIAFSSSFTFSLSNAFLPTPSNHDNVVSKKASLYESMTLIKSVSLSNSIVESFVYTIVFNEEIGDYTQSLTITNVSKMLPYLIQFYTPTVVETVVVHEINKSKKLITPERLIGIVYRVVTEFFVIIGIVFLILRKRNT